MDLNHIELPSFMVAGLYRSSLVETDDMPDKFQPLKVAIEKDLIPALPSAGAGGWKWLGENRKNILFVLSNKEAVYLPDDELHFLTGILAACKLNIGDVAIVNLANHPEATYKELITHYKSRNLFLLGVDPVEFGLPIRFPHFQLQAFSACSFLFTPSLKELKIDKVLKSKLWVCLRRIFDV